MADYTQSIDFSAKDALATGQAAKVAKGADIDTELALISTAIATKHDSNDFASQAQAEGLTLDTVIISPHSLNDVLVANGGMLGDIQALADPNADQLLGWDDSASAVIGFTLSTGLTFSTSVLTLDAQLQDISALAVTDGNVIVGDGANWVAESGATARTSLGVALGSDVQAWDANLDQIAALVPSDSYFLVGNGSAWVRETTTTVRTSLGLGTSNTVQFSSINLGHATDTTITRGAAGQLEVEGDAVFSHENTTYASAKVHFSTSAPTTEGDDGDIYYEYTA